MYTKCLHFKENEIMNFLTEIMKIDDIKFNWRRIHDKYEPYSVHMEYSKKSTNNKIYKIADKIKGR